MNRLVVIADGNAGRGRRLADACQESGIPARAAFHGAQALEMALAERPGLVVVRTDLPLVEAHKLAEILRANPRTRAARFLFLGEPDGGSGFANGVGDVLLTRADTPEEIVPTVEELIEKQDRFEVLDAETDGDREAEGELSQLPLAELLQLFLVNRKSGRLELLGRDDRGEAHRGSIWIRDGDVIEAQTGRVEGEKALLRLLAWRTGRFLFEPGRSDAPPKILHPTRTLLSEGMRQLHEWDRLSPQLPPLDATVKLRVKSAELPHIVHPLTQEVLLLLELYPRVRDVVDHCSFPDYQVLRTIHTLENREIVQLGRVAPTAPATRATAGLFDEAQLQRLRDWIDAASRRRSGRRSAKLVVASSDPEATPEFAQLLQRVPGVRLAPQAAQGSLGPCALEALGRIALDEERGIDLVHVPVAEAFSPLWGLAGHGALGTLFLLAGGVGDAAERVAGMSARLHQLPRARIFHVVLLGKGERISPDELRENLSLIDEASLFLLPLESPKEPAALLRSLFARVVP